MSKRKNALKDIYIYTNEMNTSQKSNAQHQKKVKLNKILNLHQDNENFLYSTTVLQQRINDE